MSQFPLSRLRRLRENSVLRDLVRETRLDADQFIMPLFIKQGNNIKNPISSMPGLFQYSIDKLSEELDSLQSLGINKVILFGIPAHKDELGSDACADSGIIQQAITKIKATHPNMLVIADTCFCEYTSHGHCGYIDYRNDEPYLHNDKTLQMLADQAIAQAQAGADIIAPSGNIDGMVHAIREALDSEHFEHIPILSYAVKYASAFYGPFREAAEGTPQFGDRRSYQIDPANSNETLREAELDINEGADMLMVKPANMYLDIIHKIKNNFPEMPLGAYQVSGEYAMLKAACERGWLDEEKVILESLTAIKRAGADFIITYFSKQAAQLLKR